MTSFLLVIKRSIANKTFSREYYQSVVATWNLNGWLTEAEVVEALAYLDEIIPAPVPDEITE